MSESVLKNIVLLKHRFGKPFFQECIWTLDSALQDSRKKCRRINRKNSNMKKNNKQPTTSRKVEYKKPQILGKNSPKGSFAAGCPTSGAEWGCSVSCEIRS